MDVKLYRPRPLWGVLLLTLGLFVASPPATGIDLIITGTGSTGHVIQEEGAALPARPALNLTGPGITCTDDAGNGRTTCDVPTSSEVECTNPGTSSPIVVNTDTCTILVIPELSQNTTFSPPTATVRRPHQRLTIIVTTTIQRALTFSTAANGFSADNGLALPTFSKPAGRVKYLFAWNPTTSTWALDAATQTTTYGTLGECLRSNGPGSEPSFQGCGGGGSATTSRNLPVTGVKLNDGVSTPAMLDRSGPNDYLLFDTATRMCTIWPFELPDDYASTPVLVLDYTMLSAGAGEGIAIDVEVMHVKTGADININSYETNPPCTEATLPANHFRKRLTCPLSTVDTWVAGDPVKLRICRNVGHATDTAAGHLAVFGAALRYTR